MRIFSPWCFIERIRSRLQLPGPSSGAHYDRRGLMNMSEKAILRGAGLLGCPSFAC